MTTCVRILPAAVAVTLLSGCTATFEATHDHDASHDFFYYHQYSYGMVPETLAVGSGNALLLTK